MSAAREALAKADEERRIASWAESMRVTIRLGRPIQVSEMHQRGPFGKRRKYLYELDDRMPRDAVNALYEALGIVSRESTAKAKRLEASVNVTEETP